MLLASARANVVGPDIAREYRYQTESAALFVIGVGLAFLPLLGAPEVNELREPEAPEQPRTPRADQSAGRADAPSRQPSTGCAITVAVVLAALVSSTRYVDLWQDRNESKEYFANVDRALASAKDKPVPLVDLGVPQTLLWAYRYPENAYSHVFRNLTDQTSYPRVVAGPALHVRRPGPARPGQRAADPHPARRRRLRVPAGRSGPRPIPLNGPVIGGGWWLRISYGSPRDVDAAPHGGRGGATT